jgi:hypothetical protein
MTTGSAHLLPLSALAACALALGACSGHADRTAPQPVGSPIASPTGRPTGSPIPSPSATAVCATVRPAVEWHDIRTSRLLRTATLVTVAPGGSRANKPVRSSTTVVGPTVTVQDGPTPVLGPLLATLQAKGTPAESVAPPTAAPDSAGAQDLNAGKYVAYQGFMMVDARYRAACADTGPFRGRHMDGSIRTWQAANSGVVSCTRKPPARSLAADAFRYCAQ